MSDTLRFNMPLLDAAQAQKHVSINEALVRADILAARRAESRSLSVPPGSPLDGTAHIVGTAASGDWSGSDDKLALFLNGGWVIIEPWNGLRLWVEDESQAVLFQSGVWIEGAVASSANIASTSARVIEFDHTLANAAVSTSSAVIPDKAIVLGVTGRVVETIAGPDTWSLGVPGAPNRYGNGFGKDAGTAIRGVTSQPQAYYGGTALEVTSDGAAFTSGQIRLAVHCFEITAPNA